jgi:hypothetical protein
VWELISGIMKNLEQLRADLERMVELERDGLRGIRIGRSRRGWISWPR